MNSFFQSALFKDKKVLIVVPHMDDEINVAGSMLHNLSAMGCDISVLYTTNGNGGGAGDTRIREAQKALKILTGKDVTVSVFDYVDQARSNKEHIFFQNRTYAENEMKEFIMSNMPEVLICVDMDEHPDHMCTSLVFEGALGKALKEKQNYSPIVYKGFAYKTAYFSCDDINQGKNPLLETRCYTGKLDNPMYCYKDRVRFPVLKECSYVGKQMHFNIIAKALSAHETQNAQSHKERIINSDIVFFERRTDSFSYYADIKVSSGKKEYLNDFSLINVENVMKKKRTYKDYLWTPEISDDDKEICMEFQDIIQCNHIVFYQNADEKSCIRQVEISFDDGTSINWAKQKESSIRENIYFERKKTKRIKFKIQESSGRAGISELEVYDDKETVYDYIKILQHNNFVYSLTCKKNNLKYKVYGYRHKYGSEIVDDEDIDEMIYHRDGGDEFIRVSLKNHPEIYDEIPINRMTEVEYFLYRFSSKLYRIRGKLKDLYNEINLVWKKCKMLMR